MQNEEEKGEERGYEGRENRRRRGDKRRKEGGWKRWRGAWPRGGGEVDKSKRDFGILVARVWLKKTTLHTNAMALSTRMAHHMHASAAAL